MERVTLNGADIEYKVQGSGEPLLLIHGSIIADAFFPLLNQPGIANNYRVVSYHRRGFAGSARAQNPYTIRQQAADAHALLHHLDIPRAHVAGHSYGGAIALQLAIDKTVNVHSLALLEPALLNSVPSGPTFWEGVAAVGEMYEKGDKIGTTDAFLTAVCGPDYQQLLNAFLPPGTFALAVSDLDTFFQVEMPALRRWHVSAEDAKRIQQPVLSVVGRDTESYFREAHELVQQWIPQTEELAIPQATHALQYMNPGAVADGLVRFLVKHTM